MPRFRTPTVRIFCTLLTCLLLACRPAFGAELLTGDLDADGKLTVLDVVRLIHLSRTAAIGVPAQTFTQADINQDGAINDADVDQLAASITSGRAPTALPLAKVFQSSPAAHETGVSVTRETVLNFTQPLAENSTVDLTRLHAEVGSRRLLSRVELAKNRRSLTLFYLEPLPGNTRIRVTFDGSGLKDFLGRELDADGDGKLGGTFTLDFDTVSLTPIVNSAVLGRVFSSELRDAAGGGGSVNVPLKGVTITVDGREETLRAVTDDTGVFRLEPVPAGEFFVHIDGRTAPASAWPNGAYYPFVGKKWFGVAGQEVTVGDVFLPLVAAGSLQQLNADTETKVTFPATVLAQNPSLQGVSLTVPPGALFGESGTRGGKVGMAPVAPDRLPGPLPAGVNPALVITIQTDGNANFDRPVPACFPNLPDPQSGEVLPPGAKSALWSFNHDTGRFEIVGAMTVSDDGRLVCSDPGVGILAPGWHFTRQGTQARGGGTDCNDPGARPHEPGTQSRPPGRPSNDPCAGTRTRGTSGTSGDPIQLSTGEMIEEVTDLTIPGRGFDFRWQRTYRSKSGPNTVQGNGWDHPYDVYLAADGNDLELHDGNGRGDSYTSQANGTWKRAEFFREITRAPDGGFTLTFEDKGEWKFYPLDGSPQAGRLAHSLDRNGNRMSFIYDARGRLAVVNDTLGRDIKISYNNDGFIDAITDFAGRSVRYSYYKNGESGGSFGDLKAVTSPAVLGTPNANDFPDGKTVSYTYTTGFADDRLNHNLLTVTDGRRNDPKDTTHATGPYIENVYSPATDPADPDFDRVIRQIWGGGVMDFVYVPMFPAAPNGFAVLRVIVNDRVGNVSENFFDAANRLVRTRQFTGRAIADQPTTLLDNRPKNRLRSTDPEYFETIYEWTEDSLQRRIIHPNGNISEYVYEADLNPSAHPRIRGNLRIVRSLPGTHSPSGDQAVIENRYDYDSDFGSCCGFNFITRETDARGNVTRHEYDDKGNRIRTIQPIPGIVDDWEYNEFGQFRAHIWPADADGKRRRDEQDYYESGPQKGFLRHEIADAANLKLTTTFEYDTVGNVVKVTDPLGRDSQRMVNALNQIVRLISPEVTSGSGIRYQKDFAYDANNNLIRLDVRNLDEKGVVQPNKDFTTLYEYELLNMPVRVSQEIDEGHFAVTEFAYDANRNRILTRQPEAVNGRQPANVIQMVYDERDLLFQTIGAPGAPIQSTSQSDYDANGNLVRALDGIEAGARTTTMEYDGYNRLVGKTDAMGNRVVRHYDPAQNVVRLSVEGELNDLPGSKNNRLLSEVTRAYDALNRLITEDAAHFDPASQQPVGDGHSITRYEYSSNSQLIRLINDNAHEAKFSYDSAHRLLATTDAKGNTRTRSYDAVGNLLQTASAEKSDLGGQDATYVAKRILDNLNRVTRITDNAGNVNDFLYDSRNNLVQSMDALRSAPSGDGNRARRVYDGLGRLIRSTQELTRDGTGASPATGEITIRREWDDDSRPTAFIDPNGNATHFEYDALDRLAGIINAAGAAKRFEHDAHSDTVTVTDLNGSVIRQSFDALGRTIRREIHPAKGVATDTTFEALDYDGLSRLVQADNDAVKVARGFDSLGNLISDAVDGRITRSAHDGIGNVISLLYPGGRGIAVAYDELERLKTLADTTANASALIAAYDYSGPNLRSRGSNGNQTRTESAFDAVKRTIRTTHFAIGGAPFEDRDYGWDGNSSQILNHDRMPGGFSQAYGYDSARRLRNVSFTGALNEQHGYSLDSAGNRTEVTGSGDAGKYTSATAPTRDDLLNQYTSTPFDSRTYDGNGNVVQTSAPGSLRKLSYDYANRLVSHEANGTLARYTYDALGRRVAKSITSGVTATTTRYAYFGSRIIEEQDEGSTQPVSFVFGAALNEVVSLQRNGKNFWLHHDEQGSVRRVTDSVGKVVESYAYDEFGNVAILDPVGQSLTASAIGNPHLYTGHRYDPETGFYQAHHRYYDPAVGRFITRDPLGAWGDPMNVGNAYAYVGNNPASYTDPTGLASRGPRASEFAAAGLNAPASELLRRGGSALDQAAAAGAEANRLNDALGKEMLAWYDGYVNGTIHFEGEAGELVQMKLSSEEAAQMVNTQFGRGGNMNPLRFADSFDKNGKRVADWDRFFSEAGSNARQSAYYAQTEQEIQAMESRAARLAQRGARLRTAGKVLGAAGVALSTGMAIYEDINNCAHWTTTLNDAAATGTASALMLGAPPLAIADLVTGGAVTDSVAAGLKTPGTLLQLRGRVNGRDAAAIRATYNRSWLTRMAWDAGEYWAETGPVQWLADKIVGN